MDLLANIPATMYMSHRGRPACISNEDVSGAIKRAAIHTGKDPRRFSSHSLRAGGATRMYRSGADALSIQFHDRWVTDAYKTYTRLCKESVITLAATWWLGQRGIRRCISGADCMSIKGDTSLLVPFRIELMVIT
ncbi:hypothetical protein PC119_g19137 [Phytophthora cactorum]|nr:hypothetical protein PC119_g19137 [Phytophthora cactorum]